jgi:anti-sigma regulatory factor (Ser/Thr protein kinase)
MTSVAEQEFPGVPAGVAASRRFVAGQVAEPGLAKVAALCAGELAANAIRHSRSGHPGGTFTVRVEAADTWTRIEVVDQGGVDAPRVRPPSDDAEDGRGLQIVDGLGSDWGVATVMGGHGVWVRIERVAGPKRSMPRGVAMTARA